MIQLGWMMMASVVMFGGATLGDGQTVPDFSGRWALLHSDAGPKGEVSGAVVTCGVECTITQTGATLTVVRPATADGKRPADGVVALDGTATGNTSAKWDGDKLVLTRALMPTYVVTQTLSIVKEQLVIVVVVGEGRVGPFKLTYAKKPLLTTR
jgi:hypothetical protein